MTSPPLSRAIDPDDLDRSIGPGDDFYRYANGGWLDANPVPPEYGSWGAFHEVTIRNEELLKDLLERAAGKPDDETGRMAGDYYASGMDEGGIVEAGTAPLSPFLDRIEAVEAVDDLRGLALSFHEIGAGFIFGGHVSPDFDDSSRYLLYVSQGGLGLPERDYYFRDDGPSVELRRMYRHHVAAQLRNLGTPTGRAEDEASAIRELETALAEPSYTATQLRDPDLTLNRTAVADLGTAMPGFGLPRYLAEAGAGAVRTVNLDNPAFFSAVAEILHATPMATLRAYARWNLVRSTAPALPPQLADESFDFYGRTLGGQKEQKPRWKRVLAMASSDIGELVGRLYVAAAFTPEAKARARTMVDDLVSSMAASLRTRAWMSDGTRAEALAKLAGLTVKIGYPDEWRDFSGLRIDRGPFVVNRMRAATFERRYRLERLDQPVDRGEWSMPPHLVNAYYHPTRNEIVFPAGILQPPFFFADADDAVNFGGIGAVIGHEITHGFDDKGSRFDASGRFRNWWDDADREEFEQRARGVEDQFSAYRVLDGLPVNGALTLGENIADLGGLAIAYRALLARLGDGPHPATDGFTPAQRFFLSWARAWRRNATDEHVRLVVQTDPHSPGNFRANGPLGNMSEFAAAFGLDDDAPMMRPPGERIEIW